MASSQRQIRANRANASKSTGPKSPEGKAISRANAYQHGLAGKGVVEDEATQREIAAKSAAWRNLYNLVDEKDEIAYAEMVICSVKYNRALREESFLTAIYIDRARFMWEADRQIEAAEMALNLSKNPELTILRLQSCAHGCDWLIHRWNQLLTILDDGASWDDTHHTLMCDLAGIPEEFRLEDTSGSESDCEETKEYVREQIAMLQGFKENGLTDLDQAEQAGAEAGFPIKVPQPLLRVQRYLRQHLLGFRSATATLKRAHRCAGYNSAAERSYSDYKPMSAVASQLRAASEAPITSSNGPDPFEGKLVAVAAAVPAPSRHENHTTRRARMKRANR